MIVTLTCDIVSAYVRQTKLPANDLPSLIGNVYDALVTLDRQMLEEAKPKPAVPVGVSIRPNYLVCLEDGKKLTLLKRYLRTKYDMSPQEYRARWGLPATYPMIAPNFANKRSELAKKTGLGRKRGGSA